MPAEIRQYDPKFFCYIKFNIVLTKTPPTVLPSMPQVENSYTIPNYHAFYTLHQSYPLHFYPNTFIRRKLQTITFFIQLLVTCLTRTRLHIFKRYSTACFFVRFNVLTPQAVSRRPITREVWVRSQATPCGICSGKTALG
jgi:hypothetical protein